MEEKKDQAIKLLIIRATILISFIIISLCAIEILNVVSINNTIIGIMFLIGVVIFGCIGCIETCRFFADMMYFTMSANLEEENELSEVLKKYISKKLKNIIDK